MAKEKISRTKYDEMRSYLSKKKNTKINLDDYEVDEPVSHHSNDNEDIKRELKRKQNMKNTIRLTESDLKRVIAESVKRVLKENEEKVLKLQYDENLSRSRGRKYYYCHNNGRYYTNIEGEWYICTDNYYLEPDVHLDDNVRVISESVKTILMETFIDEPEEVYPHVYVTDIEFNSFTANGEIALSFDYQEDDGDHFYTDFTFDRDIFDAMVFNSYEGNSSDPLSDEVADRCVRLYTHLSHPKAELAIKKYIIKQYMEEFNVNVRRF